MFALALLDQVALAPVARAGPRASKRFLEFFAAEIRNPNTRAAYAEAVGRFFAWCQTHSLELGAIEPVHVAAYVESLQRSLSAASVKLHLAGLRRLFDYMVVGQALPINPATPVRGPKLQTTEGKTPVLTAEEARHLLDTIDTSSVVGLRDRALIAVMLYSLARVGAVAKLKVKDYYSQGRRAWFRLSEKGSKYLQVPAHHTAMEYVDAYLEASGIRDDERSPLFRATERKTAQLTGRGLTAAAILKLMHRRAKDAGLPNAICCHTCRATGITAFLEGGGDIETAQRLAGHADPRTTKLYDRRQAQITQDEIERIRI